MTKAIRWKQRFSNFEKAFLFLKNLIKDGHMWINMLDKRNELSHTYDEAQARKSVTLIATDYFPAIEQVYQTLKKS